MSGGPLEGRRILVTRPRGQGGELCQAIRAAGGTAVLIPAIEIGQGFDHGALDRAIGELGGYDWLVFTSANAVHSLFSRIAFLEARAPAGTGGEAAAAGKMIAAIGPATEAALLQHSARARAVPPTALSQAIAGVMGDVAGLRVLVPVSNIAQKGLGEELRARGARVDEVLAYVTTEATLGSEEEAELRLGFDAVTFASPSAARGFAAITGGPGRLGAALVACIGPVTAAEAVGLGYRVGLVAGRHTVEGLVEALVGHYRGTAAAAGKDGGT